MQTEEPRTQLMCSALLMDANCLRVIGFSAKHVPAKRSIQ
jgi:hypothetical protein